MGGQGEGAYVRYEMALRRLETRATSLIGLSGSCFAVRRELCDPWPTDLASDFRTALECARRGRRAISEPRSRARIAVVPDAAREWPRKVRTVRRGLAVLFAYPDLLSPAAGPVALSLWGHKVARFTSPFALAVLALGSLLALVSDLVGVRVLSAVNAGLDDMSAILLASALVHPSCTLEVLILRANGKSMPIFSSSDSLDPAAHRARVAARRAERDGPGCTR